MLTNHRKSSFQLLAVSNTRYHQITHLVRETESVTRLDLPLPITFLNWQIFNPGFYASKYRGRQAAESWLERCPECLRSNLEREASVGCFNSLIGAQLGSLRVLLPQPLSDIQLCCSETSCQTARVEHASLQGKSSCISIYPKMPQWVRSCKQIRPWYQKSGFKILRTTSEVLWLWASDC